ncbi:MAG: alanine dehydrogenase [Bacteroidetes bacterium]|nr:alanine dehydrogenase [Bacteroidota bacterium]
MKIGLLREYKVPADVRVALSPKQCQRLMDQWPGLQVVVESYGDRCYSDLEYEQAGVDVCDDLDECQVLLGIKEVPPERIIPGKAYLIFSHTTKLQAHNKTMLQAFVDKHNTLMDYELLTNEQGQRLIGFGKWAGIVGAHYALCMIGKKWEAFDLPSPHKLGSFDALVQHYEQLRLPPIKIALTGTGRVGQGAHQLLHLAGIKEVSPDDLLANEYDHCVFATLHSSHLYTLKGGSPFDRTLFHRDPSSTLSAFAPYARVAHVLINGMFWDYRAPRLFELAEMSDPRFSIRLIADITCDVNGSVPLTTRQTSSLEPYLAYDIASGKPTIPFGAESIDVMAIGNLPNELPRDASQDFGQIICDEVIPRLMQGMDNPLLERATICTNGQITPDYSGLARWINS